MRLLSWSLNADLQSRFHLSLKRKKNKQKCAEKKLFVKRLKKDQMFSFSHSEVLPGKSRDEIIIFVIYFNAV